MKISRLLFFLFVIPMLGVATAQDAGNGFTLEEVLSSPFPSDLIASPAGDRIAWVFNAEGKRNIWVAEAPQFKARRLTQFNDDTGQEITEPEFTHDGKWIVFVRGGGENAAGDVPNPTSDPSGIRQEILAVSYDSGRMMKLADGNGPVVSTTNNRIAFNKDGKIWTVEIAEGSEAHPMFAARGLHLSPAWSPDGKKLAFVSSRNTHSFISVYDLEKHSIEYISPSVDRDSYPRWSPDGKRIAFIRQPARGPQPRTLARDLPDPWAILIADASTGKRSEAREIWKSGGASVDSIPSIAGDNLLRWAADERLVFTSEQDGWLHLYSIPTGGGKPLLLTPGECEYEHMSLSPDQREIFFSSNCGDIDRRHLWRVKIATGERTMVTSGDQIEWAPVIASSGNYLAFLGSSAQEPAMPRYKAIGAGANPAESTIAAEALPKNFPTSKMVAPQQATFNAPDGLKIHGQLFLPPASNGGQASGKRPAVIHMHGGPMRQMFLGWHNRYYYHTAYAFNQYLASKGYAVLSVNYRLGVGYGRAFRMVKNGGALGAGEYQDIVAAANYLRSREDVDQTRIGLWGGSYGGFLTALGLARNSDIFAAGVDIHGVHDWSVRISNFAVGEGDGRDAVRIARESSPVSSIDKWRSPVLLIHGDDDRNVAFSQTVDLVRRLREQKVVFEQIVYPDEVHDFLLHKHWLEIYRESAKFLDKHLKNKNTVNR